VQNAKLATPQVAECRSCKVNDRCETGRFIIVQHAENHSERPCNIHERAEPPDAVLLAGLPGPGFALPVRALANARRRRRVTMLDVVFVGATIVFFAIAWAYTLACDRL
jgi:hypothetical protein